MRKVSKKRSSKAASVSSGSDDEGSVKHKKVRNGAGKKDGANDSDIEDEKNQNNGEDNDKKTKSKSRRSEKKSNEQIDEKKKRKHHNKDESDESDESASEDEALSKIAKTSKKSDTSSKSKAKGKGKEGTKDKDQSTKDKEQSKKPDESNEEAVDEEEAVEEEYEVEEIISHKKSHGIMLYLIRWKGFGPDDDTWEKSATLDNCPDILKKYTDEHPDSTLPLSSSKSSKTSKKEKNRKKHKDIVIEEFDENADYEVERILDVFFKKDKTREFLVRWKGYRSGSDSWEPEEHLNCPDLIEKYMAKVEQAKNLSEKELRPNRKHTERFTLRTQTSERRLSRRHEGKQRAVYYDAEE